MVEKGALKLEEELELIIAVRNYRKKKGKEGITLAKDLFKENY